MSALKALESLLQANGQLQAGEPFPLMPQDKLAGNIGYCVENDAVVALSLRYCALDALPDSLDQLPNLQRLDVSGNQLTSLPECLGNLLQLKKLYVDHNQLTSLPASLGNLRHLEEIHLDANQLASLPKNIGQLTNLT